MLWEVSVVAQRYRAVLDVIRDGESVTDIAARVGVSRQTVHSWLRRYRDGGLEALKDTDTGQSPSTTRRLRSFGCVLSPSEFS